MNRRRKKTYMWDVWALLVWLISLSGCGHGPTDPSATERLVPLSVGNRWSYLIYDAGFPGPPDTIEQVITRRINLDNGRSVFGRVTSAATRSDSQVAGTTWLYRNSDDGLHSCGGIVGSDTLLLDFLYLKYPVKAGDSWQVPVLAYDYSKGRFLSSDSASDYTCSGTSEEFPTPIGSYRCLVFHWKEKPEEDVQDYWEHYAYFTPGIGMIGEVVKSSLTDSVIYRVVIMGYELAGRHAK